MDLQFPVTTCTWLRSAGGENKDLEQTLELKLPESMPDMSRVLGCWGQALVRSKQWNRDSVGLSGGVMVWVLFLPEDGTEVRSIDGWIPFQARWEIPEQRHDGAILAQCCLRGVDARSLSARKLMVRANVGLRAQALVEQHQDLPQPDELPQDVQVMKKSVCLTLPREAGEKTVNLEEQINPPAGFQPRKLLYYTLEPRVNDCKLMADRAVFRGTAQGHALCQDADGQLHSWDFEVPFSQYSELDREYGPEASLAVTMVPTGLEMELTPEGAGQLKASLIGQYTVFDRQCLDAITDAYSTTRKVDLHSQLLEIPQVTDILETQWTADGSFQPAEQVLDTACFLDPVDRGRISGNFQVLTQEEGQALSCQRIPWQIQWEGMEGQENLWAWLTGKPEALPSGSARVEGAAKAIAEETTAIPLVTGMSLGQERELDPERPSLILSPAGTEGLWNLAKRHSTTVEKILEANGLTQEPESGSWLLIPVP